MFMPPSCFLYLISFPDPILMTLSTLFSNPCSSCKKIRDDEGYWKNLEDFLLKNADIQFSHGLCQECMDEMYKNESWYQKAQAKKAKKEKEEKPE